MNEAAYYNEHDPNAAEWLRELIKAGLIAPGHVDERGIEEVKPSDLNGFRQCHFFAGIGGWSLALRLAGWPDSEEVWTGSCPCQPFSNTGKGLGEFDARHLYPVFHRLIAKRRPRIVFGEQVESKAGRRWLCGVQSSLEADRFAFGAAALCAARYARHERKRFFWFAADATRLRSPRLEPSANLGAFGQRGPRSTEDLQAIFRSPYAPGAGWTQPLIRTGDDGVSSRMVGVHGAGNAIHPEIAAEFIASTVEAIQELTPCPT